MRTRAQAADPLDVAYLAATYAVSEADLNTLLDAPTTDLVRVLLASLTDKAHEFDELKAEKLKIDVELENTVRTSETKVKAQKAAVTRHAKDVEDLRTKLSESEAAREALATELEQLRSSSSGSSAETQALRQRIDTLEASNRDALTLVESKSTEKDRVAIELSEQHTKLLGLRREISQLEEKNQALENAASSQKFKEQSLQQEIQLLKRNTDWHSNELQTRSQEHTKFRKERNARISKLERDLEDSNAAVEGLKRTEATLRQRLDEVQAKADDAFTRIASLQEEQARKDQDFRTELNGSKRLAELQAQNAATHKARLLELQNELEQVRDDTREELGRLQAEVETERLDKEDAEHKVAELELKVESMEQNRLAPPGTPRQNGAFDPQTPGRNGSRTGSPSAMPGSMRKVVGGLSFTQLYTQYTEAQEELENERRRTSKLTTALDELINEVETKKPELEDLRSEQERLEEEVLNFSKLLDDANENRDQAVGQAEHWQGEAEAALREGQILRQQLRDLSAQVKILLVELQSRDQGLGELSADERLDLERAARGELGDTSLEEMTSTGRLISERLVIFRGVTELQEQNEKLLRVTRNLGEQMEGEEAREKARKSAADAQEVEVLRQQVERYKDELQSTSTQIDSYVRERDMFRRMLQHRGQLAPDADLQSMFGQSLAHGTPQRNSVGPPATPRSKDVDDLNKLLKEQQTFFDQYRNESSTDRRQLKEQVDTLARDKSTLQADIARLQSQLTLATERYDMLQSNFNALRNENSELQKRSQQMAEQAAKQDLRTQQVAEELVEARSMAESLRNESANVKAEKDLWKRIEARLTEDNKSLTDERSRLNKMVSDLQNLQNERELADSESRRRLQSRVDSLEMELSDTKKKLESEVEDSRKAALRREYDETHSRTRTDDLVKSLGNVREELVAAKTTRDQLQSRVDEMKIELRSAEEKVAALQPRPTPRAQTTQNGDDDDLPAEQRLALQVSELRRDLELSKAELENAKQQMKQFQEIAQASEEELANFNQTADQYKEDTDRALEEKDAKVQELEQRVQDLSSELTTSNNELSDLRSRTDDSNRLLAEQKASFESEMSRLRDDIDRHAEEKKLFQEDIKAQAEIAQQAQQSYEDELVKHAEAAKSLQNVRKDYNDLRTEVAGLRAEAEAAKASLEQSEDSWSEQRDRFERELEEAKRKRHDVDEQNKILHQNLEAFSNELTALRQGRAVGGEGREASPSSSGGDANFQEIIKFLRREKEIVDVQYELSIQESKRLQQQLDYANSQLEETRQKLSEERRQSTDRTNSEGSTNKLMQTINELNLFRESATTLRNEARQAREKLEEKSKEVERLLAEVQPLKVRVGELEGELENKEEEMKLLQADRDHWRERTQNIISKYDRVDPAELEDIKQQLETLKVEKERLEAEQVPLREQVDGFDARLESEKNAATQVLSDRLDKFKGQAKDQDRKRVEKIRDVTAEKDAIAADLEKTKGELGSVTSELEQTRASLEEARANAKVPTDDTEEGQVDEDGTAANDEDHAALHARVAEAEANANEHASRAETLDGQVQALQARVQELEGEVAALQQQLETAQADLGSEQPTTSTQDAETLEKLKEDLTTAQQEVETLRANAAPAPLEPTTNVEPGPGEKSVAQQVAEEVDRLRTELEQQHELAKAQLEEKSNAKIEAMKNNLKRQLKEERDKMRTEVRQELATEHATEVQRVRDEHAAAVKRLQEEHKAELDRLSQEGASAVEKAETMEAVTPMKTESPATTDAKLPTLSDVQARELVKTNPNIRALVTANLRTQVDKQTEKLKATIAEKDGEITRLKEAIAKASASEAGEIDESNPDVVPKAELERLLDAAKKEKEVAVRQAVETVEKKIKVQLNTRDIMQAKITVVRRAVQETPDKPVKEVWDIADKARPPPPKPVAFSGGVASPAMGKAAVPSSPAQAQPSPTGQASATDEQAKLKARAERFGTANTSATAPSAKTFGQPSAPQGQATRPAGTPPNPQATAFSPAPSTATAPAAAPDATKPTIASNGAAPARQPSQSGIPAPGGSKLPRGGSASRPPSRQASIGNGTGLQIQGAAAAAGAAPAGRGGAAASGLPRGGGPAGRGGRGGNRGGAQANAGQKRQHDGAGEGGDAKRTRGGAPGAGGS